MRSLIRFRLTFSVIRKITKLHFWAILWGHQALYMKALMQRNLVAEFHQENVSFARKTASSRFWATLSGGLRGNVCYSSLASWKARSRLPIGYNCTFLLAPTAEALMRQNRLFWKGVSIWGYILGWRVTFTANISKPLDRGMVLPQLCHWKFSHI